VRLLELGVDAIGWDPVHAPNVSKRASDVVNLGYVVNVIENENERAAVLRDAWRLTRRLLVVAARLDWDIKEGQAMPCGDGVITARRTFQKFFDQDELRRWIESTLGVEADAAGPGIFYVFRTEEAREIHVARAIRRVRAPRTTVAPIALQQNRELLEPLLAFLTDRGRAPDADELPTSAAVVERFGSIARAIRILSKAMGTMPWETTALARQRDLLVYLALGSFRRRPPLKALPADLQADIRAFFGSYAEGARLGRELLYAVGQQQAINEEVKQSKVGKLTPDSLYVHISAINELPVLLRVFEACARTLLGDVPHATLVKLRRDKPKVSYLCYPTFDTDAHPALTGTFVVDLRRQRTNRYEYRERENPPVLHRKECFVGNDYSLRPLFATLTSAEAAAGLLEDAAGIGTRRQWEARLAAFKCVIEGHVLRRLGPD
jgi:DNA phosphorothioation-associated putative methyltransferase